MLPTGFGRQVSACFGASIGTLFERRQGKRVLAPCFALALAISWTCPRVARAAASAAGPVDTALPAPPPPASPAPDASGPLPPPPAPRAPAVPPSAAGSAPAAGALPLPGAPGSDLPPLPRLPLGARLHDGFYLRMGLGLGFGGALVSSDSKGIDDYSFGGAAAGFDLWLGGTPTPGLVMGGALSGLGLGASKRSSAGNRVDGDVAASTGMIAYFVDVFPDPERGLHFGGALGLASSQAEIKNAGRKFEGAGFGAQAWGGYDFWVSPQWSLGGMLRFAGSVTRQDDAGVAYEASIGVATLSFTALFH